MVSFKTVLTVTAVLPMLATAWVDNPDLLKLKARQVAGTPENACHEACGGVISQARVQSSSQYCKDPTYLTKLNDCFACANTFDIWSSYSSSVTRSSVACGIQPVLSASGVTAITNNLVPRSTTAAANNAAANTPVGSLMPTTTSAPTTGSSSSRTASTSSSSAGAGPQNGIKFVQGAVWIGLAGFIV